ncbi:hypothetical protein [Clostridium sp. D33t1_170424_F3]|uniref:hypothetical protein n=1 Tax=Clostridium sp. D33t1_170424_F3 TaxID=2787099 RepID=UPI0018AB90BA|nr:hypothetical protein [Clostridium sp. D33t1_170424_F3]
MYFINEKPGDAAEKRGYAIYPDDFPMLAATKSDFFAWKTGEDVHVETTLMGKALFKKLRAFELGNGGGA